jgi:hypothetical protein
VSDRAPTTANRALLVGPKTLSAVRRTAVLRTAVLRTSALRATILLVFFALPAAGVLAEIGVTTKITGATGLIHEKEENFSLLSYGEGRLDLTSYGNENVRGQIQFEALVSEEIDFDVPRAFIKVRFPGIRLTLGKTRVSWGEGFLFNAGDVVFESMSLLENLSGLELRDETDWMIVPYIPLGTFSYIEGLLLPHPRLSDDSESFPVALSLSQLDAGSRIVTKALGIKLEGGYLYKGSVEEHRPYVSFQGGLLSLDWHLSSSLAIPSTHPDSKDLREGWDLSVGFFRLVGLSSGRSIGFRFESGIRPFGQWEESDPSPSQSVYGIYLYPEVSFAASDSMTFFLRSIISPVDLSALNYAGIRWNIYQGFTMSFFFSLMLGDENDHFGWNRSADTALTSEMEYIYGGKL